MDGFRCNLASRHGRSVSDMSLFDTRYTSCRLVTSAEVSGHFGTSAEVSGHFGTGAEVPGHFGTALVQWCRSVLGPKCLGSEVSGYPAYT